jgi:hypothetical protein
VSPRHLHPDDADDGPALVRPYAMVGGRTRARRTEVLPVEAIVVTIEHRGARPTLERAAILDLCATPHSIAEVSAHLRIPVGVVRVLVSDLAEDRRVQVNLPLAPSEDGTTERALLERVLAGLEAL